MPKLRNIFLFAFANDISRPLRLGQEAQITQKILEQPHLEPIIEHKVMAPATLDGIFEKFNRYHNEIVTFHYGGHSDDQFLDLTDTYARSSSLAILMGMQENLQLVFLNGCNNDGQVEELLRHNIKVVIATNQPIGDDRAVDFCQAFYEALTAGNTEKKTIQQAFDTAKAKLMNSAGEPTGDHRGIKLADAGKVKSFEWELHTLDGKSADWTLPEPAEQPEESEYSKEVDLSNREDQNRLLLELTFGIGEEEKIGLLKYSPSAEEATQNFENDPENPSYLDDLRDELFNSFPSVLSLQLKDLFTFPEGVENGRLRLRELNEAYLTLGRLLNAIALSSLWDAALDPLTLEPQKQFNIREEYKKDILRFLHPTDPVIAGHFDYFWLVGTIDRIFSDPSNQHFKPYVSELKGFFQGLEEDKLYYEAYRFLEQHLRHRLIAGDIESREVEELCFNAEGYLGLLLQKFAFLSQYQLITVKDVTVYQPRQEPTPVFYHNQFTLQGLKASDTANIYKPLDRSQAINNNSLYLARNFREESHPLNLSPFVIDENAFKDTLDVKLPKVHFLTGKEDGADVLHYVHAEVPQNSVIIRKATSERAAKFKRNTKAVEKFVFEYYDGIAQEGNKVDQPDMQSYKQKELKILFEQLKLFKKAIEV